MFTVRKAEFNWQNIIILLIIGAVALLISFIFINDFRELLVNSVFSTINSFINLFTTIQ